MDTGTIESPSSSSAASVLLNGIITLLWRGGTVVAGISAVAIGLLYVKQENLLYFPEINGIPRRPSKNPRRYRSPEEHQIPYETHLIRCDDGVTIHSWLLLHPDSLRERRPTLIFFHGNAGNIGLRLPNAIKMYQHLNANVLMVEYRGYGDSDDVKPTEAGLKIDSEAALNFISTHPEIDSQRLFVFGRSLGGAVAFHLAQYAEKSPGVALAGVIVENTFLSISQMVDHLMPLVAPFKALVLRIGWDSSRIVPNLGLPVLYLAGASDELVPHEHMQTLFQTSSKASKCARMHVIRDGTHNETWLQGGRRYWDAIHSFFNEALAAEKNDTNYRPTDSLQEISSTSGSEPKMRRVTVAEGRDKDEPKGAVPLMPTNIMGMAREAVTEAVHHELDKKESKKKE